MRISSLCILVSFTNRPIHTEIKGSPLIIRPLGAGQEVGRSCIYMSFKGKVILFDCGIHPRFVFLISV